MSDETESADLRDKCEAMPTAGIAERPLEDFDASPLWHAAQQAATATGLGLAIATARGVDIQTVAINDIGVEILGRPRADILYRPTLPFVAPEDTDRMRVQHDAMLRGEAAPTRFETTVLRPDGRRLPLGVAFGRLDIRGRTYFVVFLADISERKAADARVARADRLAALGTLSAGVAHEISNPLAYVALNVDLLRRDVKQLVPDDPARARVDGLLSEIELGLGRVAAIVRDLKTFGRSDQAELGPVELAPIIDAAERLAASELYPRATLIREISQVPPVVAAAGRLEQIFVNLFVNAAHAVPEEATRNEIRVRVFAPDEHWVQIEVIDRGHGIAPDDLPFVFDPFFTTKTAGVGTGLGLPVCNAIVSRLGGEIALESTVGVGTTVRVRLRSAR